MKPAYRLVDATKYSCGVCETEYDTRAEAEDCLQFCTPGVRVKERYFCFMCEETVYPDNQMTHVCGRQKLIEAARAKDQTTLDASIINP